MGVSNDKTLTEQWSRRILGNIKRFNLEIKETETGFAEIQKDSQSRRDNQQGSLLLE